MLDRGVAQALLSFPVSNLWLDVALKAALILAAACAITAALGRASAAARHFVWFLAVLGTLALPTLAMLLPSWSISLPSHWTETVVPIAQLDLLPTPLRVAELTRGEGREVFAAGTAAESAFPMTQPVPMTEAALVPTTAPASASPWWRWLFWGWLGGAALALSPIALGAFSLWRLVRSTRPTDDSLALSILEQLVEQLGLLRPIRLVQSEARSMPMTWGLFRPVILLPRSASAWSPERLRVVLLHELAHAQRWDCLTQAIAQLTRALYWFNPLAWLALERMRIEQERACDDMALKKGFNPVEYAHHLLEVTAGLPSSRFGSALALAFGTASRLERRLVAILDPGQNRTSVSLRQIVLAALATACLTLPLASSRVLGAINQTADGDDVQVKKPEPQPDPEATVLAKVLERYIRQPDEKALRRGAIKGMIESLDDPYSEYLSPEKTRVIEQQIRGTLSGIGAQLEVKDDVVRVVTPLPGSPAFKAGVKPGDVILEIDGKTTKGIAEGEAVRRIVGPAGAVVKLKIRHTDGSETVLEITRGPITIETVKGFRRDKDGRWNAMLDAEHKIGYVQLVQFGKGTPQEARAAIGALLEKDMKGLILDLRFCPGGWMEAAIDVAQLFLSDGTIVSTRGREGAGKIWKAEAKNALGDFPLLVLVNEQTASAAEIVAGALKDNKRAIIVGTRSVGKGSVQELIPLEESDGAVRLTIANYYLPSGRSLDKRANAETWGVDPNDGYYVPMDGKQVEALLEKRRGRDVIGPQEPNNQGDVQKVTPDQIEHEQADLQLASALKAMIAKVTTGEFIKVGKTSAELAVQVRRREEIIQRRDALLKNLETINKELDDVHKQDK